MSAMTSRDAPGGPAQLSKAVHGRKPVAEDPCFEIELAASLRERLGSERLLELYARHAAGDAYFDALMRRVIWRVVARRIGDGLQIGSHVCFRNLETFDIGSGVYIGPQTYIQGWHLGTCVIGNKVWIGPQSYFDARDMVIEDFVGWGPGARLLCSMHQAEPLDVPIIETDLQIRPVRICEWADIGTNATILPGVTIGRGAIVGAGAVVTRDVPPLTVVAGVPARVLRNRTDPSPAGVRHSDQDAEVLQWPR